jgi:hypothetical protein
VTSPAFASGIVREGVPATRRESALVPAVPINPAHRNHQLSVARAASTRPRRGQAIGEAGAGVVLLALNVELVVLVVRAICGLENLFQDLAPPPARM